MQTLLEKVVHIEKEAQNNISRAEEAGRQSLQELLSKENQILDDVKKDAAKKAEQIVQESINKISNEINALRQQGESSIQIIHAAADRNRELALKKTWLIFQKEYLNN